VRWRLARFIPCASSLGTSEGIPDAVELTDAWADAAAVGDDAVFLFCSGVCRIPDRQPEKRGRAKSKLAKSPSTSHLNRKQLV